MKITLTYLPMVSSLSLSFLLVAAAAAELTRIPLVPRQIVQQRRRMAQGSSQVVELYQGLHEHYVDLYCGTPPQRQTVIVSTGARETVFPCSQCKEDCGQHTDDSFQEQDSMTFDFKNCGYCESGSCSSSDDSCHMGVHHRHSSWSGVEASDYCYIGGLHGKPVSGGGSTSLDPEHAAKLAFELNFGCQTTKTGSFQNQLADGTLSMSNTQHSFWQQMFRAGKIENPSFSLCYGRSMHADVAGTESGAMTLGGTDDRFHSSPMVYSQLQDQDEEFGVRFRKLYLRQGGNGGDSVQARQENLKIVTLPITADQLQGEDVQVESGYATTHFSNEIAQPFRVAWNELTGQNFEHQPLYTTHEEIQQLPTILIQLQGADNRHLPANSVGLAGGLDPDHPYDVLLAMPPSHYMEYDSEQGQYVPRFSLDKRSPERSILGANTIMGHDVLFDSQKNRIGWAESNCDYSFLIDNPHLRPYHPSYADEEETCDWKCQAKVFLMVSLTVAAAYYNKNKLMGRRVRQTFGSMGGYQPAPNDSVGVELELQETTLPQQALT